MQYLGDNERTTVRLTVVVGVAFALVALSSVLTNAAHATTLPAGYQETVVISGLVNPTVVRFSPDGRIFVAEKSGLIKVFDSLTDTTPTVFADLRTNVHNFWDRGLLGMALAPNFPADPSVYVLYTYDAAIGGNAPRWGSVGATSDGCPTPPGATTDGCVVSGRLSRLQANGDVMTGSEQVLVEGWCQQYPSHSVGSLAFGADGALYVSGGDGASFNGVDYGQGGSPFNPCGDPPGGVGGAMTPPTAEGGALRSQDVRTTADPTGLNGTILRVDPATGAGLPDNPLAFSPDANARRIIAYGYRNPFRITAKPGTSEIWVGDVGWNDWEEIDVVKSQPDGAADNYGWPCYEGTAAQGGYDSPNFALCESLYSQPADLVQPFFAYSHASTVVPGESCPTGSSSIAGTAFEAGPNFPSALDGALFFADYSRRCIWVMRSDAAGRPDPSTRTVFAASASSPVDLTFGPDGALYYPDFDGGAIRRISYVGSNLADHQPASASGSESAALGPDSAVDGNLATRWGSPFSDNQWWQVDLGAARSVNSIEINWEYAYASRYDILTSLDGVTFTLAATQILATPTVQSTSFSARNARYVRVLGVTRATPWGISFFEARVYGDSGGVGVDTTPPTVSLTAPVAGTTLSGTTTVSATAADNTALAGVQFKVDGVNVGTEDTSAPYQISWDTTVASDGNHTLTAAARDTSGNTTTSGVVAIAVHNGSLSCAEGQYYARYFPNATLSGASALDRCETAVTNDWGAGAPAAGVPVDGFSVSWSGRFMFAAGTFIFTVRADDGIRLFVDGQILIDSWVDQPATTYTSQRSLAAGAHDIRIEYYENAGDAVAEVGWAVSSVNGPPTAIATGSPLVGPVPLAVTFDGSSSTDPDPADTLTYAWDLDGDGQFDDSTGTKPSWTYASIGDVTVRLQTSDGQGHTTTSNSLTVTPGNTSPTVSITSPSTATTWKVGDPISFSATGSDAQDGPLPGTAFDWVVIIQHCPSNCHAHTYQTFDDTASGSFPAPDHEYPSYIQLRVTATDADGATATASLDLQPRTVDLTFASSPPGLQLAVGADVVTTPFTSTVIVGSINSVSAVTPQSVGNTSYGFASWSDGGAGTHSVTAPATATTYTATYAAPDTTPPTVSITAPVNGATVSGGTNVQATASDASGVAGVQFKLDGAVLGAEDTSSPYQLPWDTTKATPGQHVLTAVARDANSNTATSATVTVTVQSSTTCPAGQWKAEYFPNLSLTGLPAATRCETTIANDWGSGSPVTGIGADNFSVRWSGRFLFPAGSTTFFVTADDGIRLRVDGSLLIDQWRDQSATAYRLRQTLAVGDHDVSIEYYERAGLAVAKASWRSSLVAAYNFDESSGSSAVDGSANGNNGTITGASRTNSGKYGRALSFNGTSNWVTIADAGVLDLSTQMTIEAWVYPTSLGSASRSVVVKEAAATLSYALDAHRSSRPGGRVNTGTVKSIQAPTQLSTNIWSHLAVTYDGAVLRFFVNGTLVTSSATIGIIAPSTGVLRIGGSGIASEWFAGRIDDVRLYARALDQVEIQGDSAAGLP